MDSRLFCVLFQTCAAEYLCSMGAHAERMAQGRNRSGWQKKGNLLDDNRYPLDVIIEGDTGYTQQFERQQDKEAVAAFNAKTRAWGAKVDAALDLSIGSWITTDKKLSKSLKQNYRHYGKPPMEGQEITSIGFSFKEEGVYVHLGVGKGYNMENGTRILTKTTDDKWNRNPKPWFNPVIEQHIPELIEIVKEYCGTLLVNTTRIYINT